MDPKQLNKLDPKLRDAYQRIMNTQVGSSDAPIPTVAPTIPPPPPQMADPTTPVQIPEFPPPSSTALPDFGKFSSPFQTPPQMTQFSPQIPTESAPAEQPTTTMQMAVTAKNSPISTPLLLIMAIIFFLVYTLFWVRFFNVKLPFPLPF